MLGLKFLEIINKLSFVFSFVSYFFYYRHSSIKYILMYISTVIVIVLGIYLKEKKKFYIFTAFLMIPILTLFQWNLFSIIISTIFIVVYLYLNKGINYINFSFSNFIKKNIIYLIIILLCLITKTTHILNKVSALFMIIYFISSIALFRNLKYLENNANVQEINRQNFKYAIGITLLSFLLSIEHFWQMLIFCIKTSYKFLLDIMTKCFYWVFILLGYLFQIILNYLHKLMNKPQDPIKIEPASKMSEFKNYNNLKNEKLSLVLKVVFKWLLIIFLIFLVVYIIWKSSKRYQNRVIVKEDYIEKKEFIITMSRKKAKKRNFFKPQDRKELLRYYYSKFLNKCKKQKILLTKYNTTLEINEKSKEKFLVIPLEKMRKIYINVRYGDKIPDKKAINEFKKMYKKL